MAKPLLPVAWLVQLGVDEQCPTGHRSVHQSVSGGDAAGVTERVALSTRSVGTVDTIIVAMCLPMLKMPALGCDPFFF